MNQEKNEALIRQLENYIEIWKQFNQYLQLAASRKFTAEDESHFLEVKSLLTQELEIILSQLDSGAPNRAEVHALIATAPSMRFLSDARDDTLRVAENQWHKLYIAWHAILGQLKVQQRVETPPSRLKSWFGSK